MITLHYQFLVVPKSRRSRRDKCDYDKRSQIHDHLLTRGARYKPADHGYIHDYYIDAPDSITAKELRREIDNLIGTKAPYLFKTTSK